MRIAAIVIVVAVAVVIMGITALGPAGGVNRYRLLVEAAIVVTALSILALPGSIGARGIAWASTAIAGGLTLALLTLGIASDLRKELFGRALDQRERGFVLSSFGRPDLTNDGIGTSPNYGYRSALRPGDVLVISFQATEDVEDAVASVRWMQEEAAIGTYHLHPPGTPGEQP